MGSERSPERPTWRLSRGFTRITCAIPPLCRRIGSSILPKLPRASSVFPSRVSALRSGPSAFSTRPQAGEPRVPGRLADPEIAAMQDRVYLLTRLYRVRGHRIAQVDPLGLPRPVPPELTPEFFGFTEADMDLPVYSETFQYDGPLTLGKLLERLRNTYCRSIGVQYMHIDDLSVRRWLQRRMEATQNRLQLTREEQLRILTRLTDAVTFEEFIRKKFVGAKTFSLDGSESLIPLLDLAIEKAGEQGIREIVLGHGASRPAERAGQHHGQERAADLPRIRGYRLEILLRARGCEVPSGPQHRLDDRARARRSTCRSASTPATWSSSTRWCWAARGPSRTGSETPSDGRGMALLIHGDAAFAGEGVVQETLNLSQLAGYTVGGTLHVVVNNQIGFTTSPERGALQPLCDRCRPRCCRSRFST